VGVTSIRSPFELESLVRPVVRATTPYSRDPEPVVPPALDIHLDLNESPYGPSPKTRAALAEFATTHRYPEFEADELRAAIGGYLDRPADQIIVGSGLDDVITTMAMLLIDPGDRVIISEPTFGVYRPLFTFHGADVVDVPLREDFSLDVDGMLAACDGRTKLVIVCNPNNPTGNLFDTDAVERIVAEATCLVAIDEAYAEFAGYTHLPLMDRYPNVAVLRTMSKFAGLAGMRVGYGVFPALLMPHLLHVMPAFGNVSTASTVAAIAALGDLQYLSGVVATIVADRERLTNQLRALPGVDPCPSATNFLLVRLPVPGGPVVRKLADRGIYVRRVALHDYLRVTVGLPEENALFLHALTEVLTTAPERDA